LLVMGNDYTNRYSECWWNFPSWLRLNPWMHEYALIKLKIVKIVIVIVDI
jgi:hypothetical protein